MPTSDTLADALAKMVMLGEKAKRHREMFSTELAREEQNQSFPEDVSAQAELVGSLTSALAEAERVLTILGLLDDPLR